MIIQDRYIKCKAQLRALGISCSNSDYFCKLETFTFPVILEYFTDCCRYGYSTCYRTEEHNTSGLDQAETEMLTHAC